MSARKLTYPEITLPLGPRAHSAPSSPSPCAGTSTAPARFVARPPREPSAPPAAPFSITLARSSVASIAETTSAASLKRLALALAPSNPASRRRAHIPRRHDGRTPPRRRAPPPRRLEREADDAANLRGPRGREGVFLRVDERPARCAGVAPSRASQRGWGGARGRARFRSAADKSARGRSDAFSSANVSAASRRRARTTSSFVAEVEVPPPSRARPTPR